MPIIDDVCALKKALQKKPEAPSKKEVQVCIVNVVGMDAYEAAVLQVKNKMEKSKIDPTKQVMARNPENCVYLIAIASRL